MAGLARMRQQLRSARPAGLACSARNDCPARKLPMGAPRDWLALLVLAAALLAIAMFGRHADAVTGNSRRAAEAFDAPLAPQPRQGRLRVHSNIDLPQDI